MPAHDATSGHQLILAYNAFISDPPVWPLSVSWCMRSPAGLPRQSELALGPFSPPPGQERRPGVVSERGLFSLLLRTTARTQTSRPWLNCPGFGTALARDSRCAIQQGSRTASQQGAQGLFCVARESRRGELTCVSDVSPVGRVTYTPPPGSADISREPPSSRNLLS